MAPRVWPVWIPGAWLAGFIKLCRGPLDIALYQIYSNGPEFQWPEL